MKKLLLLTLAPFAMIGCDDKSATTQSTQSQQVEEQPAQQQITQQSTASETSSGLKKIDKNYKKVKQMEYSTCLGLQQVYNDSIGKNHKVIELKKTDSKSAIKYCATDGATSVTCDKNKNTMTLAWADMSGC